MREHKERGRLPAVLRAPLSGDTWREYLYVLTSFPIAVAAFCFSITMLSLGAGLLVTFVGLPVLVATLEACRGFGFAERSRARALLDLDVATPEPVRTLQRSPGLLARWGAVLRSGVSWRHVLFTLLHFPWATLVFSVWIAFLTAGWGAFLYPAWGWVLPTYAHQPGVQVFDNGHGGWYVDTPPEIAALSAIGLVLVLATPWLVHGLTQVDRLLVWGLLGPSRAAERIAELESDRGAVADTAASDLRRIERDLHDGAQARLVNLAMELGLAKGKLLEDPEQAAQMVDDAHGEVKLALAELRDLARGIHPAILTDRGLGPALSHLAARCTVPVTVTDDLQDQRPARAIEGIAYFTASELLQNISKHAVGATRAEAELWRTDAYLMLQVTDDGRGGAGLREDGGLTGLAERLQSVDGLLTLQSPPGGPTVVTAQLPWREES
ncbi:sensor domain-containing protein [Streptomyces sp. ODS28]|uniref:sensor histidine kinase n=1 Tax=Streptomyces sp. ODS28 TaxID=3136688 RepID=UPI0031E50AFC